MTNVTIFGGTGYAGSHIAREAAKRGHVVASYSRKSPDEPINGVRYVAGTILSAADRRAALDGAGVVIVALSPRGDMATEMRAGVAALAADVSRAGVRLGVVGGAGSLLVAGGGPQLVATPEFPAEIRDEATTMGEILEDLRGAPDELDWFYVSPSATFGSFVSVESRGRYRVGGEVLLVDENGQSEISGEDFAIAVVDEIEQPKHHRTRFTVGY